MAFFFFCNRMRSNDTPKCFSFVNLQRSPTPALSCVILFMTHVGKVKQMKFLQTSPPHTVTEIQRASGASLTVSPFTLDPPESQSERINVNYLSFLPHPQYVIPACLDEAPNKILSNAFPRLLKELI